MNNHENSEGGSDLFKRAKAQELGQRRMVQTSFVSSFPSAGGAAELTGDFSNKDGSYVASVAAKKNPFATISLIAETKAPMTTSPSSSLDVQIDDASMKQVKDAQSLLRATGQGLMSIFFDPFSPAIIPAISTKLAGTSASESKSIAPVQATSAFTGFTFQPPSNINYRDTTKQAPQINSSSSSNQGFTFFPTASTSSKTNSEIIALGESRFVPEEANEDEEEGSPKDEPEKALRESNEQEDTLYETRVKHYKFLPSKKEWKDFGTGVLRVMQEKGNDDDQRQRKRMVLRNEVIGSVLLNVAIVKGMKFSMEPQLKANTGCIRFVNPADEEAIMLKVRGIDTLEKFHSLLTQLAK
jgi:hypothetical protein